jgi:hypothetical protein
MPLLSTAMPCTPRPGFNADITAWIMNLVTAQTCSKLKEMTGSNKLLLQPDPTLPGSPPASGHPVVDIAVRSKSKQRCVGNRSAVLIDELVTVAVSDGTYTIYKDWWILTFRDDLAPL